MIKSMLEKPMTLWYECSIEKRQKQGEISARIRIPEDSPWFDGHFPQAPVLPGIAQLGMVHDLICRALSQTRPVESISRVRFKQMIRPDQPLLLTVAIKDEAGPFSFRISDETGLICSGLMHLKKP